MSPFEISLHPEPPSTGGPHLGTNSEILQGWREYFRTRSRPVTVRHYGYEVGNFVDAWPGTLVSSLKAKDVKAYLRLYERRCQHYRRGRFRLVEPVCAISRDLAACGPYSCPAYNPVLFQTVEKHLQAIVSLFDFLVEVGDIEYNFIRDVKRSWVRANRRRHRIRPKRNLRIEEIRRLIRGTSRPNRKVLYAVLAKSGIRIREALLLRTDADHMNLQQGWLKVPEFEGKRRGNRYLVVDFELRPVLTEYLHWRESRLRRNPNAN